MKGKGFSRRSVLETLVMLGVVSASDTALGKTHRFSEVERDFADPYLELIRLLKEGAEIEQDLMIQYMYGAYSLRPAYADIVGAPAPGKTSLMGIVIEEMQHLGGVNRLLVELGAKPVLTRQDYPYESDVYPFPFETGPLNELNLAKFTFCESDKTRLKHARSVSNDSGFLLDKMKRTFGGEVDPNHVGSLYDAIVLMLGELKEAGTVDIDFGAWFQKLGNIKADGEFGHFKFFQSLYEGAHPLLKDIPDVWNLPASDERHPCYEVPVNPTAYEGRANTIKDPDLRSLAWLGNLNYWAQLLLLDGAYRRNATPDLAYAQAIMMGPLHSIAKYLPTKGSAVPFDPLSMGFDPGLTEASGRRITKLMLEETRNYARSIEKLLPTDFNPAIYDQLIKAV